MRRAAEVRFLTFEGGRPRLGLARNHLAIDQREETAETRLRAHLRHAQPSQAKPRSSYDRWVSSSSNGLVVFLDVDLAKLFLCLAP